MCLCVSFRTLQGVDTVYVIPPGHIDRAKIGIAGVDAAKAAGAKVSLCF